MKRKSQVLVLVILGLAMLGFNLIAAVDAVGPPPYEDAMYIHHRYGATICESDASFVYVGWFYWVEEGYNEWELLPVPLKVEMEIGSMEIKLSRNAIGRGNMIPWVEENSKGPLYLWYAYFEPYYFEPGTYTVRTTMTCKDPDSPSERIVVYIFEPTLTVLPE